MAVDMFRKIKRFIDGLYLRWLHYQLRRRQEAVQKKIGAALMPAVKAWIDSIPSISSEVLTTSGGPARKRNRNIQGSVIALHI